MLSRLAGGNPRGCNVGTNIEQSRSNLLRLCLITRWSGDVLSSVLSLTERMMLMSTYEEFSIILTVALLIVSILNMKNKM